MQSDFHLIAAELITAGQTLHALGMVPATSGNLSARLADGSIAITVSGTHKGRLQDKDIMSVSSSGNSIDGRKPSAETGLHLQIYQQFPQVMAVLHPHSRAATLTHKLPRDEIILEGYELLKAFDGISTHQTRFIVPVFENDQDIPGLAGRISDYMNNHDDIGAYIIRGHGFYTWGRSVQDALRHCEALEFLLQCELNPTGFLNNERGVQ